MKHSLVLLILFFSSISYVIAHPIDSSKKYCNSIKLSHGLFWISDGHDMVSNTQIQGRYERKVYKNWYVSAGYAQWYSFNRENAFRKDIRIRTSVYLDWEIGSLYSRINYKMVDAGVFYRFQPTKTNAVNAGINIMYAWGQNAYIDYWLVNPEPPHDALLFHTTKKVNYIGIVPNLSYDYYLIKNRLVAGIGARGRYYLQESILQMDCDIHAGFNF